MARRLTLIAGSGSLPKHVRNAAERNGDSVQVLALGGRTDLASSIAVEAANPLAVIAAIKAFGSTHVTMAGGVLLSSAERAGLAKAFGARDGAAMGDGALSALGQVLATQTGATLLGPHEVAADLIAAAGHIAGPALSAEQSEFATFALRRARDVGALDLGQALVTLNRQVIAAEDVAGTDALLLRVKGYRDLGFAGEAGSSLILAKASKPGQPIYVDLPAIGAQTVARAKAAGVSIIVVEAGRTLLLDRERLVAEAEQQGISVVAIGLADG